MTDQLKRLEQLQDDIHSAYGMWGADDLAQACAAAAEVPGFGGNPETVRQIAANCDSVFRTAQQGYHVIFPMQRRGIDQVWTGDTKVSANDALRALMDDLCRGLETFRWMRDRLTEYASWLERSLASDAGDAERLRSVAAEAGKLTMMGFAPNPTTYDGDVMRELHTDGMAAIDGRVATHISMRSAGEDFTTWAHDLAAHARGGRLSGSPLSALDELVIAEAGMNVNTDHEAVLTAAMDDRAAAALSRMNDADRRRMIELLGGSVSPEQRAYLLKTLAAGYSVDDVARLNAMIAAHGADPTWLDQHLSPLAMDGTLAQGMAPNSLGNSPWSQGQHPTCVASSTVAARAEVDPVYALQLTTGGHPGDPAFENPQAFTDRLRDEQNRVYDEGRHWYENWWNDGMTPDQSADVGNQEIAPHTGMQYDNVKIGDADSRQGVLGSIERAVDDGYPVPLSTHEGDEGHQLMVIGHVNNYLQIYNPWGYTYLVTAEDFVSGHVDRLDPDIPSTPYAVRLPHQAGTR
jgi:hypothetical protein